MAVSTDRVTLTLPSHSLALTRLFVLTRFLALARRLALASIVLLAFANPLCSTPMTWGDKISVPIRWPKGSTIRVYIQKDPDGKGRDQLAKEGVERWKSKLAERGITLEVTIGDPPAGAKNAVPYTWENDGYSYEGLTLGEDNDAVGGCTTDRTKIIAGEAHLRNGLKADSDADKDLVRNLAEHEMTHILGLADDSGGSVTNHTQPDAPHTWNDQDTKELNTLYGTASTQGDKQAHGNVHFLGGGPGRYDYAVEFVPGNEVPDPDDPEHVPLITFGAEPGTVLEVLPPPGWMVYLPPGGQGHPFFAEGYMMDGAPRPSPWDPAAPTTFVALRASLEEAMRDGMPPGLDPALGLQNPVIQVTLFTAPDAIPGDIDVWAGGEVQRVIGPVRTLLGPYTLQDVLRALAITVGQIPADGNDFPRLNLEPDGTGPSIDLRDVTRIARKVAGLDPNP